MDTATLKSTLHHLITTWENEVVEFKEAANDFDTDKIGRYVSALSIEANLRNQERAWLVFGVRNSDRQIVGTSYRDNKERLHSLKQQIAQDTEPGLTFREIYELDVDGLRVVMFEIPAAPRGIPISWKGQYCARNGEGLATLSLDKFDTVRNQSSATDWTAQVVPEATLDHLDPEAILRAREAFVTKHANSISADEIKGWSDQTFLDRAKLTQQGKLTRASILLLGKNESTYLLSPHPAQLTWKLVGPEEAYEHFGPPFFLSSTRLYKRIRNIQLRLLPDGELIPHEIPKYDQKVVLEALHNCIAHQDYSRNARIVVTEYPAKLVLENEGSFFEGKPEDYVTGERTPHRYRNTFLVQAMAELNMIDTMGRGIFRMHKAQRERYFPMPDYKVDGSVSMTIHGGVVDPAYTRLLMQNSSLPIIEVLALDRVQKKLPIPDDAARRLRHEGLIEGRKPNYHVSAEVAGVTGKKAQYIRNRAFDDKHFQDMILEFLKKFSSASRKDIDELLWKSLSDALNETQKRYKIGNLLSDLRKQGKIRNTSSKSASKWQLEE
jgi:ATP-dependent DNA helicase RecG